MLATGSSCWVVMLATGSRLADGPGDQRNALHHGRIQHSDAAARTWA